jgi:hypothetical protein
MGAQSHIWEKFYQNLLPETNISHAFSYFEFCRCVEEHSLLQQAEKNDLENGSVETTDPTP